MVTEIVARLVDFYSSGELFLDYGEIVERLMRAGYRLDDIEAAIERFESMMERLGGALETEGGEGAFVEVEDRSGTISYLDVGDEVRRSCTPAALGMLFRLQRKGLLSAEQADEVLSTLKEMGGAFGVRELRIVIRSVFDDGAAMLQLDSDPDSPLVN